MTKKKVQATTKVQIPVFPESVEVATVTASEASNMLVRLADFQRAARQNTLSAMVEAYKVYVTGAVRLIPKYRNNPELGIINVVSDTLYGPQRTAETAEQYTQRWMKTRSTVYAYLKAGYLLTFLSNHNWLDEVSIRPHMLSIVARIVGHAAMGGDAEKTCAVAVDLINGVESGKIPNQEALRNAVRKVLGEDVDDTITDTKTVMVSVKASGLTDDQVKAIKAHAEATMRAMIAAMGGKA